MPITTTIKFDGLQDLGNQMRLLSSDIATKICKQATAAAAKMMKDAAIVRAPQSTKAHRLGKKDEFVQPGNLKRNIIIKKIPVSEASGLTSEHILTFRNKGHAPKNAFYGIFDEFGTVKMRAQPFLRPTFEEKKYQAVDVMAKKIQARIEKVNK